MQPHVIYHICVHAKNFTWRESDSVWASASFSLCKWYVSARSNNLYSLESCNSVIDIIWECKTCTLRDMNYFEKHRPFRFFKLVMYVCTSVVKDIVLDLIHGNHTGKDITQARENADNVFMTNIHAYFFHACMLHVPPLQRSLQCISSCPFLHVRATVTSLANAPDLSHEIFVSKSG